MEIPAADRDILRRLAAEQAEIAALPVHRQKIAGWTQINGLRPGKPMVWINELPWHELDVDGELTLRAAHPFARAVEDTLRKTLYQWRHLRGDMVVEPVYYCPLVIYDSGLGISEDVEVVRTDAASDVVSRRFHRQIDSEADLARIETPRVRYDAAATDERHAALTALFGDILPIVRRGAPGFWFAPWDELIRWWGVEAAMLDLVLRPELVHLAMERLVSAYLARLDQYVALNLLARNDGNVRIGSGGLGYCDELPPAGADPAWPRPDDLWGCATAQIFSDVSPRMHEGFALQYERRWLERFGLTYYGCCEPLHLKLGILESVPNLRKVSMSPWARLDVAVAQAGARYVYSIKPSPAPLAEDVFHLERMRAELIQALDQTRGLAVEVIMKDVSTVRYQPQRLWAWAEMAAEVTARYA